MERFGVDGASRSYAVCGPLSLSPHECGKRGWAFNIEAAYGTQKKHCVENSTDIQKVTDDIERRQTFNTAIAAVMGLLHDVSKFEDHLAWISSRNKKR